MFWSLVGFERVNRGGLHLSLFQQTPLKTMLLYMTNRIPPPPPKECSNFQSPTKMLITSKVLFQLTITEIKYKLTVYYYILMRAICES